MDYELTQQAAARNFTAVPASRAPVKAVDIHTHAGTLPETALLLRAAELYGIDTLVVIVHDYLAPASVSNGWAGSVVIAPQLRYDHLDDEERFLKENLERIEQAGRAGVRLVKFWFTPRFYATTRLRLDDPRLAPLLARIDALGMGLLVHVSDPDIWFERVYTDRQLYGTKAEQYPQLEAVLDRHPRMPVVAAHMGGDPEHLDHLQELLDRHPNLFLDTSATKWMIRELGRQREAARDFFIRNRHRIVFGTDQVVTRGSDLVRYTSRYWTHRLFWETSVECPSPVEDPDCDGMPVIRGLDLPGEVLADIYRHNAERILGTPPPAR
ncbi:MAG: amidohydrolase family protein [Limnochordaceae bacterium]|nr:amidohydrolase family protein [Limnochordaceae bacterium]